jgi:hypothetical protein
MVFTARFGWRDSKKKKEKNRTNSPKQQSKSSREGPFEGKKEVVDKGA